MKRMRKAVKKMGKIICAYQLGTSSPMEKRLIQEGKIRITQKGNYELFSREAYTNAFSSNRMEEGRTEGESNRYLFENHLITINYSNKKKYFNAFLWGAQLSAAIDAVIVIYNVKRGGGGRIENVDFHFIAKEEFDKTYDYVV